MDEARRSGALPRWPAALCLLLVSTGLVLSGCGTESEAITVEPCPEREHMYRDTTVDGNPCKCKSPEIYVLNTDATRCIECTGSCDGQECGDDGCGRLCGDCPQTYTCDGTACVKCVSECAGRECGDDGCGRSCGSCPGSTSCEDGACVPTETMTVVGPAYYCCSAFGPCALFSPVPEGDYCYCIDFYTGYSYPGTACNL